VFEVIFVII